MDEELRRIELEANPPLIKQRELTLKEKLHFWWADVKHFMEEFIPKLIYCMLLVFAYLIWLRITVQIVREQL